MEPPTLPEQTWQDAEPNQEEEYGITQIHGGICSYTAAVSPAPETPSDTLESIVPVAVSVLTV